MVLTSVYSLGVLLSCTLCMSVAYTVVHFVNRSLINALTQSASHSCMLLLTASCNGYAGDPDKVLRLQNMSPAVRYPAWQLLLDVAYMHVTQPECSSRFDNQDASVTLLFAEIFTQLPLHHIDQLRGVTVLCALHLGAITAATGQQSTHSCFRRALISGDLDLALKVLCAG